MSYRSKESVWDANDLEIKDSVEFAMAEKFVFYCVIWGF